MPKEAVWLIGRNGWEDISADGITTVKRWKAKEAAQATAEFLNLMTGSWHLSKSNDPRHGTCRDMFRMANDQYRKVFNAQVYANTGNGTYEKAVDYGY